jgi:hypothetical protein
MPVILALHSSLARDPASSWFSECATFRYCGWARVYLVADLMIDSLVFILVMSQRHLSQSFTKSFPVGKCCKLVISYFAASAWRKTFILLSSVWPQKVVTTSRGLKSSLWHAKKIIGGRLVGPVLPCINMAAMVQPILPSNLFKMKPLEFVSTTPISFSYYSRF